MATTVRSGYSDFAKNWNSPKHAFFSSNRLFQWKKKIFNVSEELEWYFQYFKKYSKSTKKWHAGKVRIQRFWEKLRSPQNMLFFLQTDCFHERTKFRMFRKNWNGIFNISKNTQTQPKNGTPVTSGYIDFGPNWKVTKTCLFFLQTDCFNERTKFWMFHKNWKRIFRISKNTQNQPKNGHAGKVRIQRFCQKLKSPQNMLFFLQSDSFHERTKCWMFPKNWNSIFNISKNTQNQPKNGTPVRSGYSDFAKNWEVPKTCFFFFKPIVFMKEQNFECFSRIGRVFSLFQKILKINQKMAMPVRSGYIDIGPNWKVPKTCLFFLQRNYFHERTKFWIFLKNWKGIFNISKNTQNQQKNGHAGKVRIQRFCQKLKSPQNMLFFLQSDSFHERTKCWMFPKNWNSIFNISKNTQNQPKNGTPVRSGYSDFAKNWEVPKTRFFFFKPIVFMKEQNFECFRRIGSVFSAFEKILKINQKMAMPVKSGYSDFPENWKVPKTCFFFFKVIVFMKEQNFECFRRIGRVFSLFQKILKINKKMGMPVRSGYSNFAENWEVPKKCFSLFKPIVFIKEQNFECFRRIGRVFSTFQKILKINQKMPRR